MESIQIRTPQDTPAPLPHTQSEVASLLADQPKALSHCLPHTEGISCAPPLHDSICGISVIIEAGDLYHAAREVEQRPQQLLSRPQGRSRAQLNIRIIPLAY